MKKLLLIFSILFSLTSFGQPLLGIIASSQNNSTGTTIPRDGLIREYLLNGNANETVSSQNGIVDGCTYVTGINGEANGAIYFNGTSSDFVTIPTTSAYAAMTISCWLNLNEVLAAGYFFGHTSAGYRYNGTDLMPKIGTGTANAIAYTKTNDWIHFVLTRTSSTTYNVYINNSLLGTHTNSTSDNFYISLLGKRSDGYYYKGPMAKLRIYNRVVSSGEITALFQEKTQ